MGMVRALNPASDRFGMKLLLGLNCDLGCWGGINDFGDEG